MNLRLGAIAVAMVYSLAHLVLRLTLTTNLNNDEAEWLLLSQSFRWIYDLRHTPLLAWLGHVTWVLSDRTVVPLLALKYALLAIGLLAYLAVARQALRDDRLALCALLGLMTTSTLLHSVHIKLTFAILLALAVTAFVGCVLRVLERGTAFDYALLGAAAGAGFWAKYIFALPVASFAIAIALTPDLRRRIAPRRLVLACALALAVAAPVLLAPLVENYSLLRLSVALTHRAADERGSAPGTVLLLAGALAEFLAPFVLVFAVLFWRRLKPRAASSGAAQALGRLFETANLASVLVLAAAALALQTTHFPADWLYPVLLTLPIALFLRVSCAGAPAPRLNAFVAVSLALLLLTIPLRVVLSPIGGVNCPSCVDYWPMDRPFARLGDELSRLGAGRGTIVAEDFLLGGNLLQVLPDARVAAPPYRWVAGSYDATIFGPPSHPRGACTIVWSGPPGPPDRLARYLETAFGVPVSITEPPRRLALPRRHSPEIVTFNVVLLGEGSGDCR